MPLLLNKRVLFGACGLALACGQAPEGQRLRVVAGSEYLGAAVSIDGTSRGTLAEYSLRDRFLFAIASRKDGYPDVHLVELEIPASSETFEDGLHRGELTKQGLPSQSFEFVYPFRRAFEYGPRDLQCSVVLGRRRFIVGPECSVKPWKRFERASPSVNADES
jgi:hypothetical protein